jgi:hypothetical protein
MPATSRGKAQPPFGRARNPQMQNRTFAANLIRIRLHACEAMQLQSQAPIDHICNLPVPWSILRIRFGRSLQF